MVVSIYNFLEDPNEQNNWKREISYAYLEDENKRVA
jgi:hypothetical protein